MQTERSPEQISVSDGESPWVITYEFGRNFPGILLLLNPGFGFHHLADEVKKSPLSPAVASGGQSAALTLVHGETLVSINRVLPTIHNHGPNVPIKKLHVFISVLNAASASAADEFAQ
jgi:hypothetical protein